MTGINPNIPQLPLTGFTNALDYWLQKFNVGGGVRTELTPCEHYSIPGRDMSQQNPKVTPGDKILVKKMWSTTKHDNTVQTVKYWNRNDNGELDYDLPTDGFPAIEAEWGRFVTEWELASEGPKFHPYMNEMTLTDVKEFTPRGWDNTDQDRYVTGLDKKGRRFFVPQGWLKKEPIPPAEPAKPVLPEEPPIGSIRSRKRSDGSRDAWVRAGSFWKKTGTAGSFTWNFVYNETKKK